MSIGIKISVDRTRYGGLDADAQAFLTEAGITDATITNAINRLVKNYKGIGDLNSSVDLWTGSSAIYPMVGGSATTNKFNLKDPRDLDAAYRLGFSGGWTHGATGSTPNGINAYADSYLKPNALGQNSARYGYYSRTQYNAGIQVEIGCFDSGNTSGVTVGATTSTLQFGRINEAVGSFMSAANTTTLGWFMSNRRASNIENIWKNKTKQVEVATASVAPNAVNVQFACQNNNGSQTLFSSKQMAFGVIGAGLIDASQAIEYDIIQAFQTDLARNI